MKDDLLRDAFRALREETSGTSPDAEATLARVHTSSRARARPRRRSFAAKVWIPIAAVLVASSAWAGASGRLGDLLAQITERNILTMQVDAPSGATPSGAMPSGTTASAATAPCARSAPMPTTPMPTTPMPTTPMPTTPMPTTPMLAAQVDESAAASSVTSPSVAAAPSTSVAVAPRAAEKRPSEPPAPARDALAEEMADYEAAYRVHASGASSEAVASWDAYLAKHPKGRFVLEAQYARAVALARSGDRAAAAEALKPFADGGDNGYRRDDAAKLLKHLSGP